MHRDPLSQYQVDEFGDDARVIPASRLKAQSGNSPLYLVLAKRNDAARMFLHNTLGTIAGAYAIYRLYASYNH